MSTKLNDLRVVTRQEEGHLARVSLRELELSTTLYRLIGETSCEVALLSTAGKNLESTREEVYRAVIRCQHNMIAELRCTIELEALGDLDKYSRLWKHESTQACSEHNELLGTVLDERCAFMILNE